MENSPSETCATAVPVRPNRRPKRKKIRKIKKKYKEKLTRVATCTTESKT